MKKEYIQPKTKIHKVMGSSMLTGVSTGPGETPEQNAKRYNLDLYEGED